MRNSRAIDILLNFLRVGLGVFFLVTGVLKIGDMGQTADFLTRSDILPEFFSMPLACIGIAMELVVAVCLIFRQSYRGAAVWGVVMTAVFLLLYMQAWARGLSLSCNCMGTTHEIIDYPQDTGVRLLLLGAMLLLVWDSRRRDPMAAARRPRKFDFSDA
ncbi:MAG: DoxX family membrane protein [Akkermansia sp.]|nr:DoxX family membrane protein [Akkermansia sp.]